MQDSVQIFSSLKPWWTPEAGGVELFEEFLLANS
jgi:hypothetical protein